MPLHASRKSFVASVVRLNALVFLCAISCPVAVQAAPSSSASARSIASESACSLGTPLSSTGGTSLLSFSTSELSTGACLGTASADAGSGRLNANSFASGVHNVVVCPGCVERAPLMRADASAGLSEVVRSFYSQDPVALGITTITAPVSIKVSGGVGAGTSADLHFVTSAVSYSATVAGMNISGSKVLQSSSTLGEPLAESQTGHFGDIDFNLTLSPGDFNVSLAINAIAEVNARGSGLPFGATSSAEALHSLRWLGITGPIIARNAAGGIVALPNDFAIDMVGQSTGFNYSHAALAPVPEPQSGALLVAGLSVVGFVLRKRRNRKCLK